MIVAFSTSSPLASVALFDRDGALIDFMEQDALRTASSTCLKLMQELMGRSMPSELRHFAADTGPGSFIGSRVAVTLAKTLAFARGGRCYGAPSFDLISPDGVVVVPNRKGEWFVRDRSAGVTLRQVLPEGPFVGYGDGVAEAVMPHAKRFADLFSGLEPIDPAQLVPTYLVEPSISLPNRPYAQERP